MVMELLIFICSCAGMIILALFFFVGPWVLAKVKGLKSAAAQAVPVTVDASQNEVAPKPIASDERPSTTTVAYLQALKKACPSASNDVLFGFGINGLSLFEATQAQNKMLSGSSAKAGEA